jgi:macrolide transport system ATP-binding/permease protein
MNLALRIYRRLAQAFPHEFKLAYGVEVMLLGEDLIDEIAKRQGTRGLIRLIADIAIRVPLEYLSEMRCDMRYGLRTLIKSPGFAVVGILSMGLGIGLTTTIYNAELQTVLRELPAAANAKRLVMAEKPISYYYIEQYRQEKSLFAGVAAFQNAVPFNISLEGDRSARPERVFGQLVSPDYFSVLGVQAEAGRLLSAGLDKPGDTPVVVISDRFWRNRLNSSPRALGQVIRLNGQTAAIVGIAPKDFGGAASDSPAELFVPITVPASVAPELGNDALHQRNAKEFMAIMCLALGVTIESAEGGLDAITRHLDEQDSSALPATDKGRRVTLLPADTIEPLPREFRPIAIGFFAVLMGLIMTIACMNLANMLVARGANRRKELAIRVSVGASRFRLMRQMMSEGVLLSLLGGIAGIALAYWLNALHTEVNPLTGLPLDDSMHWDAAVFAFVFAIVCGIGFSLLPAWQATTADAGPALKEGSALQFPGHRRFGLRNVLMVTQVAGSLMLLLLTGFLVLGIKKISRVQTNFDPKTMYLLSIDPVRDGYTAEKVQALFEKLPERLKTVGGVRNVVLAAQAPFSMVDPDDSLRTTQLTAQDSRVQQSVAKESVGSGYFASLSVPILAGREFEEIDQRSPTDGSKPLPVMLNESAAREFFGNGNVLEKLLRDGNQSYEVAGIVPDLKIGFGNRQSVIYLPLTRRDFARPPAGGMTIMVRADAGTDPLSGIRNQIASMDPNLTIIHVQTLKEYLDYSRAEMRTAIRIYGGIGVFGLVLVSIGLSGVTAYAVAQRRREIGIRTALGATRLQVLRLVLREGTALVGVGTVLGFLGAILMARLLSAMAHLLVEALSVGTNDPRLLVGAPLLLASLAMFACYLPARRTAQINPLTAIREE